MRNYINFLMFSVLFFSGCIKEEFTIIKAYLINETQHTLTILHYTNGIVLPDDTIKLGPKAEYLYGEGSHKGDVKTPLFITNHQIGLYDSVCVVFDNSFMVVHYVNVDTPRSDKYYLYNEVRNMVNPNNYFFVRNKKKGKYTNTHTYTFTEDDYLFAKD